MSHPIKQHTVPKTYLRHFSSGNNKVWVYQKDTDHLREQSIQKVPIKKDIYTITNPELKTQKYSVEERFADVEQYYTNCLQNINSIDNGIYREVLSMYIAAQKLRTPKMKDQLFRELENFILCREKGEWVDGITFSAYTVDFMEYGQSIPKEDFDRLTRDVEKDSIKADIPDEIFSSFIIDVWLSYSRKIRKANWGFLLAPNNRSFITSDNPALLDKDLHTTNYYHGGGIFTLDPKLALYITSNDLPIEYRDRKLSPKDLREYNKMIIYTSERFVFGPSKLLLQKYRKLYQNKIG